MAKLSLQDLANVLVEKNGLGRDEAEHFMTALFDCVLTGIERDKLVKIKGLGTFKVIDVDARESVNVNTGERVLIDSHSKVTFTPDATMKELVNKPFSGFETVVLNEGVEFEDMVSAEEETVPVIEEVSTPVVETEEAVTEPQKEPEPEIETVPVLEPVIETEPEPETKSEPEPEVKPDSETPMVEFLDTEENKETTTQQKPAPGWHKALTVLISLCVGFAGGYFYANHNRGFVGEQVVVIEGHELLEDSTEIKAETAEKVKTDSVSAPVAQTVSEPTTEASQKSATEVSQKPAPESKEKEPDYMKYENMDSRVRTGAYYIMGTASVVKAREGDNVARVSRRYLGEGMSCYVEVYNGMTASTKLQEGQEIKIPKVVPKKNFKK